MYYYIIIYMYLSNAKRTLSFLLQSLKESVRFLARLLYIGSMDDVKH
jgi:hypothetical protein